MNRDMSILITQFTFYIHKSGWWSRDFWRLAPLHLDQISAKRTLFIAKINHNIHPSVSSINHQYFRFRNCKLAFETADLRLGITPLLDVCDVARDSRLNARAQCGPDRLSILTYVSLFHHKFTHDARVSTDSGISSPTPETGDSSRYWHYTSLNLEGQASLVVCVLHSPF